MKVDQKKVALFLVVMIDFMIVFLVGAKLLNPKQKVKASTLKIPTFYSENVKIINQTAEKANIQIEQEKHFI